MDRQYKGQDGFAYNSGAYRKDLIKSGDRKLKQQVEIQELLLLLLEESGSSGNNYYA